MRLMLLLNELLVTFFPKLGPAYVRAVPSPPITREFC